MEWVLFYTDPWLCQKGSFDTSLGKPKPRLSLEEHGNNNCGGDLAENQDFEGVILEICTSKIIDHFGGACFLPSFSGTSLSYHGGSRFGDTFWGAFSCPSEISANHMGRFLATLSSWDTLPKFKQNVVKQFLCEGLSSYHVVHALHYQKRTLSTLKIRKAPCFKAILVILGSRILHIAQHGICL